MMSNEDCVICYEVIDETRPVFPLPNCDCHPICEDCIVEWLKNSNSCPLCRREINDIDQTTERDQIISEFERIMERQDQTLRELDRQIAERDRIISEFDRIVKQRGRIISEFERIVEQRNQRIKQNVNLTYFLFILLISIIVFSLYHSTQRMMKVNRFFI